MIDESEFFFFYFFSDDALCVRHINGSGRVYVTQSRLDNWQENGLISFYLFKKFKFQAVVGV